MYNPLVESNIFSVRDYLSSRFPNSKKIEYSVKNKELTGIVSCTNKWHYRNGAISVDGCLMSSLFFTFVESIVTIPVLMCCPNALWTWIIFAGLYIGMNIISIFVISATTIAEKIVVVGIGVIVNIIILLICWQWQQADPIAPKTIPFNILFKFKF